jgi:hypothetical protein
MERQRYAIKRIRLLGSNEYCLINFGWLVKIRWVIFIAKKLIQVGKDKAKSIEIDAFAKSTLD